MYIAVFGRAYLKCIQYSHAYLCFFVEPNRTQQNFLFLFSFLFSLSLSLFAVRRLDVQFCKKKKLNSHLPSPIHRTHIPTLNHSVDIFEHIPELFSSVPTCLSSNSKFLRGSRGPKRLVFYVKNLRHKPLVKAEISLPCY